MDKNKCNSCGESTHKCSCKNKDFTKSVIEIDNPGQITLMRKVVVPASMGDDTTVPPVVGKYHNVLLNYEANNKSYLYSSDGIPTLLTGAQGEQGPAGTVTVGTTTTGEPGSSASVENVGTSENAVLNFTVPQGPRVPEEEVQEEINNKLDAMAEDGTLEEIIGQYLNPSVVWGYDTVSDMKSDTTLTADGFAKTLGFYSKDDVGGAYYKIRSKTNDDTIDEHILIQLNDSSLVAELVPEQKMNILQFGIAKDSGSDEAANIQKAVNYCNNITFEKGTYITNSTIRLNAGQTIDLNGGTIDCSVLNVFFNFLDTDDYTGYNGKGRITIKNGTLTACISFFHADYLEFSNLTFNECKNDHCIQLAGCRNVEISECVFNGSSSIIAITHYYSAINLDPCDNGAFPLAPWDLPNTWDLTPCANFHIHDNFFNMVAGTPSGLDFVRGLDAHYTPTLSNRHTHMDFYSNTIIGSGRSSNYIAQWDYANIHDNTFISPRIGLTVFSCGDINIFSNVFNYNGNGATGEPIEVVNRSTNLAVYNNTNNYVIDNSTPPTVYKQDTYKDVPFTITVGRMDYAMSGASQQVPNAEFALSVPYNTISNLLMYVGKAADLYTLELNSFYSRKFEEGDVFKFQTPLGNITFTFIADNKIRYENTDPDPTTNQLRNVLIGNNLMF